MGAENSCLCKAAPECKNMAAKEQVGIGKDAPRAGAPLQEEDHKADAACLFALDRET